MRGQLLPRQQRISPKDIQALTKKIAEAIKPEQIVLFGSYAYGQPTPDSDVDLLIIWNTRKPAPLRYRAISDLIRPRPFPLDIIVRTPREIEMARKRIDPFLNEALRRGKVLYARQLRSR